MRVPYRWGMTGTVRDITPTRVSHHSGPLKIGKPRTVSGLWSTVLNKPHKATALREPALCAPEVAGSWNSRPGAPGQGVKAGPESLAPCAPPRSHVPKCSLRGGHAGCPGRGRKKRPTLPLPRAGGRTFPVPGWGLRQRGCAEPAGGAPGLNL